MCVNEPFLFRFRVVAVAKESTSTIKFRDLFCRYFCENFYEKAFAASSLNRVYFPIIIIIIIIIIMMMMCMSHTYTWPSFIPQNIKLSPMALVV